MAASMENVYNSLFQAYSSTNDSPRSLRIFTESLTSNQLLVSKNTSSIQEMLGHVHSCLTMTKERMTGLHLLKVIISQCSTEVFQQNAERWIRLLLQIIQGHCDDNVYRGSLHILGNIFEYSKTFSDVSRIIVTNVIQELVPVLLAPSSTKVLSDSISCINKCIETYPGPLGPFKGKLLALIYKQLSRNTKSQVVYKCFALLCQCGPGGSKGVKHTDSWHKQCNEVLGSLEHTLDSMYEGFEPDSRGKKDRKDCLPLSEVSHDQEDKSRVTALKARWLTLCGCLEAMLSEEMDATARIPIDRIIQLACRGLAVNSKMVLSKPTSERMLLASFLTEIHQAVLRVMEQFIVTCRRFLMPYSSVITGLLSQELLWTKTKNSGHNMTFSLLRGHVFKVMTVWLKVLDGCSGVSMEAKTWIEEILHDCSPFTESLLLNTTLTKSSKVDDAPKLKKKKKGYQELSDGISSQKKVHVDANSKLVQAGLEVLYWLITTSGSELDRKSLQAIHSFTIRTLLTIQQTGEKQMPIPYSQSECRRSLYRVLKACVINPHPHAPPPTQCAVRIFSHGQTDKNLEVSSLCIEAMRMCEVVLHPRAPVLNGPIICEHVVRIGADSSDHTDTPVANRNVNNLTNNVSGNTDDAESNNKSSYTNNKGLPSKYSAKRPFDESVSAERTKFVKIQSDGGEGVAKDTLRGGNDINVWDEADSKTKGDDERNAKSADVVKIDEENDSADEDNDSADEDNEDGNIADESSNTYIATKYIPDKNEMDIVNNVKEDKLIADVDADVKVNPVSAGTEEEMTVTKEEGNNEEKDEEVATMMLTFVDADPDNN